MHLKLAVLTEEGGKLCPDTDVTSANQLPRPGDHTVNDSALFFFKGGRDITLKPAHHILTQDKNILTTPVEEFEVWSDEKHPCCPESALLAEYVNTYSEFDSFPSVSVCPHS